MAFSRQSALLVGVALLGVLLAVMPASSTDLDLSSEAHATLDSLVFAPSNQNSTNSTSAPRNHTHHHQGKEKKKQHHHQHQKKHHHHKKHHHNESHSPFLWAVPIGGRHHGGPAPVYGNVRIARVLETAVVVADALFTVNMTVAGKMKVNGRLHAQAIRSKLSHVDKLYAKSLRSPSGTVFVDGDLAIVNTAEDPTDEDKAAARRRAKKLKRVAEKRKAEKKRENKKGQQKAGVRANSFLAEDLVIGGMKQWKLVRHESFEGPDAGAGWSLAEISSCTGADHFLGGHCNLGEGQTSKRFQDLPPHSQVRLTARYHMIDNWQGETAFLKLGEHYVWSDHSRAVADPSQGVNMCGADQFAERRFSIPVDVSLPHEASFLDVSFGSTALAANKGKENPCLRSFGVDDVMVYVR